MNVYYTCCIYTTFCINSIRGMFKEFVLVQINKDNKTWWHYFVLLQVMIIKQYSYIHMQKGFGLTWSSTLFILFSVLVISSLRAAIESSNFSLFGWNNIISVNITFQKTMSSLACVAWYLLYIFNLYLMLIINNRKDWQKEKKTDLVSYMDSTLTA